MPAAANKRSTNSLIVASTEWITPRPLVRWIEDDVVRVKFDLDAAASPENAVCERYYTEEDNSLIQEWTGNVWLNPPYGRIIGQFLEKCSEEFWVPRAKLICALVPDNGDTVWYNKALKSATRCLRFTHRIQFDAPEGLKASSNTSGSALFLWDRREVNDLFFESRKQNKGNCPIQMITWPKDKRS